MLSLVVQPGTDFTWWMRLAQGGAALAIGAALAWPLRRTIHALWLAPLAVVVVRLALDPVRYPWYWLAVEVLVLVGAVELLTGERSPAPARGAAQPERLARASSSSSRAPCRHARRPYRVPTRAHTGRTRASRWR